MYGLLLIEFDVQVTAGLSVLSVRGSGSIIMMFVDLRELRNVHLLKRMLFHEMK